MNQKRRKAKMVVQESSSMECVDDNVTMIEGLRKANKELIEDNKKKTIELGSLRSDIKQYLQKINQLSFEVQWWKNRSHENTADVKSLHSKFVEFSNDFVQIILKGTVGYPANESLEKSARDLIFNGHGSTPNSSNAYPNVQQRRAVKPMIGGLTIQNPVINLPRVSPEQLERLGGQMRQAIVTEDVLPDNEENANVDENQLPDNHQDNEEGGANEDNEHLEQPDVLVPDEDISDPNSVTTAQLQIPLNTIMEESVGDLSNILTLQSMHNPANNISLLPTPRNSPPVCSRSVTFEDSSLADISNTITIEHVTVRRGLRKRNIRLESDIPELQDNSDCDNIDNNNQTEIDGCMSNTFFSSGATTTSTPANPVVSVGKRRKLRKIEDENLSSASSTPTLALVKTRMKKCSVVLKRIATTNKKSISPKHSNFSEMASVSSSSSSTVGASSPKGRPTRRAKPVNLKESSLKKKIRG